jgi:homocysteine S-methyltransferase
MDAAELIAAGPVALDGGLASELEARGHDLSGRLWSARLLVDDPGAIRGVHEAYYAAGARVATTASYQVSRLAMAAAGLDADAADDALRLSVELAQQARAARQGDDDVALLVAASVGPYGAALADGSEYRGGYGRTHDELVAFHAERLAVLAAAGPDVFAVETIPDAFEAAAVVEALAAFPEVPAWVSYSCRDDRTTCGGDDFAEAVRVAGSAPSVVAVGVNCTAPEHVAGLLARARDATDLPLVAYPNAGRTWDATARAWAGEGADVLPDEQVRAWADAGAWLIGGCCGLGPRAIARIASVASAIRVESRTQPTSAPTRPPAADGAVASTAFERAISRAT